jgi:hypothetical protein
MLSASAPAGYAFLEKKDIQSRDGGDQAFIHDLVPGVNYYVIAEGIAKIGTRSGGAIRYTDADFFDSASETMGFSRKTAGTAGRFEFSGVVNPSGGVTFPWTPLAGGDHAYGQVVKAQSTGPSSPQHLKVKFRDAPLTDNLGSIEMRSTRKRA